MPHGTHTNDLHSSTCHTRYVCWSGIVLGAFVAIGLSFLFNLFNAGIGLLTVEGTRDVMSNVGAGGYIWLLISGIIAMFFAGLVAGYFAGNHPRLGILHGFGAWCLALIIFLMLVAHMSSTVGAAQITAAREAIGTLGMATLGSFLIFLLGAIASCIGGYVGTLCKHGTDER